MKTPTAIDELCILGDQHLVNEQWGEAENLFQQALLLDAKSKRALLGRAKALRTGKYDYEQAQRLLNRCLYHYPLDAEALVEQGRLHADRFEHHKAVDSFDLILRQDPSNSQAVQGKIRSLLQQGLTADARQVIESIAPNAPRPSWLLLELAHVYIAEGAYDVAVEAFLDAGEAAALHTALADQSDKATKDSLAAAILARQPDNTEALVAVANAHSLWGDLNAAIEVYREVVQAKPNDEDAHLHLIELFRLQERFDEAEETYQKAVQFLGRTSDALLMARAGIFFDAGKRDHATEALIEVSDQGQLFLFLDNISDADAIHTLEALVERQPPSTVLLKTAVSRLAAAGNTTRALELLDHVLELDPIDIQAMMSKGDILLDQGRLGDLDSLLKRGYSRCGPDRPELVWLTAKSLIAREHYAEAVRLTASVGIERELRARVDSFLIEGDVVKAEKLVNAALAESPNSISFLEAQGRLLLQQRRYDAAAGVWNAIHEKQPDDFQPLIEQTFALRAARRFDEAAQVIEQAIRRHSAENRQTLHAESGLLHYDQGQYKEAVQAFDAALALNPNYGFAHLWKIRTLRVAGQREEAEAAIKQARATESLYGSIRAEITCEMGKLYDAREEWKAAVASYEEARREDAELVEPYFLEARALLRMNLNDEAERLVQAILNERGTENEVKEQAGWFYLSKNDFRRAEAQFQEILGRAPSDFSAVNGLGGLYFEQGKFDLAEQQFRRAGEIDQRSSTVWNNLAWALVRQVDASNSNRESLLAEAESNCRKAIEMLPKDANAHACLGIIAFKQGRLMECEDLLKRAIALDPTQTNYSDLGALYAHLGRFEEGQKILEKGCELNRYDLAVRVELGNVYLQTGQTKLAVTVLREACAINPQAPEPVRALSIALSKAGDLIEALNVLRSAIKTQDMAGGATLRIALCRVLTELAEKTDDPGLYAEALTEVRLAITAQPKSPDAYFHAGVVCFKQRDHRAAVKHFRQCKELAPTNFEAEQNLRKLKALMWEELGRARIGVWVGATVGIICFLLLIMLWWMYLLQPVPTTKEAIRQIDSAMLLTLSPILLSLVFVALLLPWLSRFKLPGGVEAELAQPKEAISSGPSGLLTISLSSSSISSGPK